VTAVLRVGVIGVGVMGADHAARLGRIPGAVLAAVSDPSPARTALFPGVPAFASPLDLIASPSVDAVLIASPGAAHEEQVLACLEHGKYVLCEKPLALTADAALRLVRAEGSRRLVQVGFMRRFDPGYGALHSRLASGSLGSLLVLHNVHRNLSAPPSFRSEMIIRDSLVHEVDVCRWLFSSEVAAVSVLAPTPSSYAPAGVRDPQVAIFQMAGGGIATTEVFINSQVGYVVRCEAVAERASVTAGGEEPVVADFRSRFAAAYDAEVLEWVSACLRGEVIGPSMWDGYAAAAVCEAGVRSLSSGGAPVEVTLA
jgi:myo-inositol 2-dehydrogenase/D-chiro-inositol 1-dehydrogenase